MSLADIDVDVRTRSNLVRRRILPSFLPFSLPSFLPSFFLPLGLAGFSVPIDGKAADPGLMVRREEGRAGGEGGMEGVGGCRGGGPHCFQNTLLK